MPVDKFGTNDNSTTTVYTGINIANLSNSFLRREEGNTAIEAIDLNLILLKLYRIRCQINMLQPIIL